MSSSEARTRLLNFVCIEPFHRLWAKHGLTEDDLIRLENEILAAPRKGDEIRGSGGFRKLRLSREGSSKGKSGSYRVLYLYIAGLCHRLPRRRLWQEREGEHQQGGHEWPGENRRRAEGVGESEA